ncbi:cell death regulator Aven-like [Thrips palmi]|uniref:Cell death regulator Aven-like n=1 Tax=Thrips palmi TaxID=161013 RepID=A0A6P8ZAZ0_THRPL|nr:cell death regulator Aven-like [Thrips palmi]
MDDFNAKKSRAQKFRQDKYRDRHKKHPASGSQGGKSVAKNVNQETVSKEPDNKALSDSENSEKEEMDSNQQTFSRRKMVSNWDRYEETVVNRFEEEAEPTGALFEELLSMPISGGHLKMKHEHEWGKEKSELQMPWFQLDIKDVEKNLATMPFLLRQNLSSTIFTESHLQRMTTRAKQNAASLTDVNEGILKMQSLCVTSTSKSAASSHSKSTEDELGSNNQAVELKRGSGIQDSNDVLENDDLDSLLALDVSSSSSVNFKQPGSDIDMIEKDDSLLDETVKKTPLKQASPVSAPQTTTPAAQPSVSLDDWLDSILDD